ncbi:MAG: xylulokinase [Candidatus Caldatribacteriaceae bacterium]
MAKFIIAHDLGTTGNKATLFDEEGNCLASAFCGYETYFPDALSVEQNALDYWEAVVSSTRKLLAESRVDKEDIAALSFSGQMMGALPVDEKGNPLYRILIWADRRGIQEVEWIKEHLDEEKIYKITGHRLSANYSLAKILWFRNHQKEVYQRAHKFLLAKDFVIFRLTGEWVTDFSDASGTNLFDLEKEVWSEEIMAAGDISPEKLPSVYPSTTVVGELSESARKGLGLSRKTKVVIGGGDGACAACGAGVVREGQAYHYLGSSSWIALASFRPFYDEKKRTFTFHHLEKGLFMPTGTMQSAGGSYQWCRDTLCKREKELSRELEVSSYLLMDVEASRARAGCENLLFLPYLMGERAPWWNPKARGAFVGLTPRHQKAHLIRAVLEGVALNLRIILDVFREKGVSVKNIRLIGGGARGDFWAQILSNVFNLEVLRPLYVEEATSLGAALCGGVGVGLYRSLEVAQEIVKIKDRFLPHLEEVAVYDRLYPVFKEAYLALEGVFEKLSEA